MNFIYITANLINGKKYSRVKKGYLNPMYGKIPWNKKIEKI